MTITNQADSLIKAPRAHIRGAVMQDPLIVPESMGKLLSQRDSFCRNVTYITRKGYYVGTKIKPREGEIGIFNGRRIVINLPVGKAGEHL